MMHITSLRNRMALRITRHATMGCSMPAETEVLILEKLTKKEVGKRLKSCRAQKGYTLQELATISGVDRSTIQRYETGGIVALKPAVVEALSAHLDVNPKWITGESDIREADRDFEERCPADVKLLVNMLKQIPAEKRQGLMQNLINTVDLFMKQRY